MVSQVYCYRYLDSANYELPYQSRSDTSKDAAQAAAKFVGRQGEAVYGWFVLRGLTGGTQRECREALGIGRPSVAARVHALECCGRLVKTAARRDGCAVYLNS